jgi:hypothetical protein
MEKEKFEMPEITIDEQFKDLLPALDEQTYAMLEESLLENGCLHPLVTWNGILIDGHNRYEICQKHEIPFATIEKEFASREETIIWIIQTQVARRNLTPIQLSYFRGLHYRADKRIIKNEAGTNQYEQMYEVKYQSGIKPKSQSTAGRLADEYKVSPMTINRDAQLANAIDAIGENSAEAKQEILSGTAGISRTRLQELAASGTKEEIENIAQSIEQGTYERPKRAVADESSEAVFQSILETLDKVFAKMAEAYGGQPQTGGTEAARMKASLRSQIDKLEQLYNSL